MVEADWQVVPGNHEQSAFVLHPGKHVFEPPEFLTHQLFWLNRFFPLNAPLQSGVEYWHVFVHHPSVPPAQVPTPHALLFAQLSPMPPGWQ